MLHVCCMYVADMYAVRMLQIVVSAHSGLDRRAGLAAGLGIEQLQRHVFPQMAPALSVAVRGAIT